MALHLYEREARGISVVHSASDGAEKEGSIMDVALLQQSFAEIEPQKEAFAEAFYQRLFALYPQTIACHVHSQVDGRRLLSDSEAMRWLARWGQRELIWSLEVFTPNQTAPHPVLRPAPAGLLPPPRPVAPPQPANLPLPARYGYPPHRIAPPAGLLQPASQITPPQRIVQAEQGVINSWPRKHRQIFALIDGKRSVRQKAVMLKQPPRLLKRL